MSGKIEGMPNGVLLLMSDEKGVADTLGVTTVAGSVFEFTGIVDGPIAAYITTSDGKYYIPLILENTSFMVNATQTGALIKGGESQDIFGQFTRINVELLKEQRRIQDEYRQAQWDRNGTKMQALQKELGTVLIKARQLEKELLRKYADTYVAAYVIAAGMEQADEELLKEKYSLLTNSAKATVPGRAVAAYIEMAGKLIEGNVVPDFTVVSPMEDSLSLYPLRGKLKLIHFWAYDNYPSREANVDLVVLYQKYHLKGLEIVSISEGQDKQAWKKALNVDGMTWKHGLDGRSAIARHYHVRQLPYTILLDDENRIVAKGLLGKELQKRVGELLKKK